jgi:O-antigen/teichoic acid export membrane protein
MFTTITRYVPWLTRLDYNMKDVMRGAAAAFSLRVLASVLGFGFSVLLARLSGAEGVGIYYLAGMVTGFAAVVGQLGLDNALLRFTAANAAQANWIGVAGVYRKGLWIATGVSVLVTALVIGGAPWIAQVIFSEPALVKPLRLMALAILPLSLIALYGGLLKGLEKIWNAMLVESVSIPLLGLPLLALFGWAFGVNGAVAAFVTSTVFALSFGVALWRRAVPQVRGLVGQFDTRLLITTGLPLFWIALMNFIMSRTDMFLLGIWENSEWVGIYGVAKRISDLVVFILVAVNSIVAPKFAALYAQGDFQALDALARNTASLMIVLATPIMLVFILVPSWVLEVFGPDFRAGGIVLAILATGQFVNVATGSVGYLLMMTGHEKLMRNNIIACTILNVALSAILIPRHGVVGAALATTVSLTTMNLVSVGMVYWKLSIITLPIPRRLFTHEE